MITGHLDLTADQFAAVTGWEVKPEGACKGEVCVPLGGEAFDLADAAERLGMALVHDEAAGLWAIGPGTVGGRALSTAEAPELVLPDVATGKPFSLSGLRGTKVLIAAWAPYWGCRYSLPGWQALRDELHADGFEIVTVGLEIGGADVLRPIVEAADVRLPALVDDAHRMDALFGVDNIPQNVWIDETGTIVRPPETGGPAPTPTDDPMAQLAFSLMAGGDPEAYANRVRDWVAHGSDSTWAMDPDEVIAASHPRSRSVSEAAACFELAQHRWRQEGFSEPVLAWFGRAHTLQPDNITYKRQAYSAWSYAKRPDEMARFAQVPEPGREEEWPFVSDFSSDMATYMPEVVKRLKRR